MSNFAKFYTLLKQMPQADKETLVDAYSGGRTSSLRDFASSDPTGFRFMIADMESKVNNVPAKAKKNDADEPQKRRFRSLILRAMQDQGVMVVNGDWSAVNEFVRRYAGRDKKLSTMTLDELKTFNSQVHKLLDWNNNKREMQLRKAMMN